MTNHSIDVRLLQARYETIISELDRERKRNGGPSDPPGGGEMEARVARLETHVEYIRRDLDDMKADVKEIHSDLTSIKRRMAYLGGAGFVVAAIFAWVINNRFDQVVSMLTKAAS